MQGIDVVIVEVGSTVTKASAIGRLGGVGTSLLARGDALTTVTDGDVIVGVERALADMVSGIAGSDIDRQIEVAFERTLSRKPDSQELGMARNILRSGSVDEGHSQAGRPLMQLCHALLNLNEFVYVD